MFEFMFVQPQNLKCEQICSEIIPAVVKNACLGCFPQHNFTNEFVIYHEREGQYLVLGYIHIIEKNISDSKYFSTFAANSIVIADSNPFELKNMKAYQILEWEFDEILRNKVLLEAIFQQLSVILGEANKTIILWRDYNENFEYYPFLNGSIVLPSYAFGAHFSEIFIKD